MEKLGLERRACDTLLQDFGSSDLNCQKLSQEDEKHQQRLSSLLETLAELPLERLLTKAVDQAQSLGDQRTVAYALGNLAELYEKTKQLSKAKELNKKALLLAETIMLVAG